MTDPRISASNEPDLSAAETRIRYARATHVRSTSLEVVHLGPSDLDVLAKRIRVSPRKRLDFRFADRGIRAALSWAESDDSCPLPGHDGIAFLGVQDDEPVLRCSCLGEDVETFPGKMWPTMPWTPLPDAYHSVWTGVPLRPGKGLSKPERFSWRILLAHHAGLLNPADVELDRLPDEAGDLERDIRELAALMFGLRLAVGSELEMPLPVRFCVERLRLDATTGRPRVGEALRSLCRREVLRKSGEVKTRGRGRPTYLYLPGSDATVAGNTDQDATGGNQS